MTMTGLYSPTETGQLLANSVAQAIERTGHVPGSGTRGDSARLWSTLAELGFAGIGVDPRHGGAGGQLADLAPALTLLGQKLCITPAITSMVCATWLIEAAGSARQAGDRLPALAEGALTAALAHTEHAARNHPHFVETRARRAADGWVLDGAKPIVPDGGTAGLFVVSARTSGTPAHADGISLFLVPAGAPGLACRTVSLYDGSQAASTAFDGLTLSADALLASEGKAAPLIEMATDRAIAALCAEAVGVMDGLFELTRDYLRTREQFGQPIAGSVRFNTAWPTCSSSWSWPAPWQATPLPPQTSPRPGNGPAQSPPPSMSSRMRRGKSGKTACSFTAR